MEWSRNHLEELRKAKEMAVNIEVHGKNSQGFHYPMIMIDLAEDLIIFITEHSTGTVLKGGRTRYNPGYHGTHWYMNRLVPFTGRITLENK